MNFTEQNDKSAHDSYDDGDFAMAPRPLRPLRSQTPHNPTWRDGAPTFPRRSKAPLIFFLLIVLILLSITLFLFEYERRSKPVIHAQQPQKQQLPTEVESSTPTPPTDPSQAAEQALKGTNAIPQSASPSDPFDIITAIGEALAKNDFATAELLIGKNALSDESRAQLRKLASGQQLKLRHPNAVREVGELEINQRLRFALELADREVGKDRIYFDLKKEQGVWKIEKMTLPPTVEQSAQPAMMLDALGITDAFLLATLQQNFSQAKKFVNAETVSDATIAGLCILFEEGNYKLRPQKPLRATLQKELLTTFLAYVVAADHTHAAQFGITLRREKPEAGWMIHELNLDQLLSDYATRVAGGDVHYTPLIKNPNGGDTLVLYFDFDANELTPRTQRQLSIVATLLKTDERKKINLSGHTDSLGSREYNQSLSGKRAEAVRDFLVQSGVKTAQIITAAKGLSEPRRPNVTETGQDDPEGRRVNRRTEIYLDF